MVWTAERTSVNQRVQIGAEATTALGTVVPAGKLLECFDWTFGINADVKFYRPTGHKYETEQEENTEWVDGTLAGNMDYNGIIYPLASVYGSVASVAHSTSATAKDWIFTPPTTGSIVPQTYTLQQGDAAVRAHQTAYSLFTEFAYKGTRKDFTCSAKFMAQPLLDAATLTASPTAVAMAPMAAKHFTVYLDSSQAGLGTTQLMRVLSIDYQMTGVYGPLWTVNRTNLGWVAHVDLAPKAIIKLKLEADAAGMALLSYLQTGTTYYLRVDAQGNTIATDAGTIKAEFKHDMAVKFNKPSTFADDQGVFAIEWEANIIEDPTWGNSQVLTCTNLISTL